MHRDHDVEQDVEDDEDVLQDEGLPVDDAGHPIERSPNVGMGDLGAIAVGLAASDPISQFEQQAAMFQRIHTEAAGDIEQAYARLQTSRVALSALKDAYNGQTHVTPLKAMTAKSSLKIDDDLVHSPTVDRLLWKATTHFLDYLLAVSSKQGLWATLPNIAQDHNYNIQIDLNRHYQRFHGKHGKLGFDPGGSMLYLGKCRSDEVWIACASKDIISGACEPVAAGICTGSTQLSTRHYRMIIDFLATCLASIPGKSFICFRPYQVPLDTPSVNWEQYNNIM